jgi:hypothetical protein
MTDGIIEFLAYLPPIQSAIMISGEGDLLQAKFNINLHVSPAAARLVMMTGKRLKITVEEAEEVKQDDGQVSRHHSPYSKTKA